MHPDSFPQDLKRHSIKEAQHQKAFEALLPIVQEDYCFFESVMIDYFPEIYNDSDNDALRFMHGSYIYSYKNNLPKELNTLNYNKWLEMCEWETNRRIRG